MLLTLPGGDEPKYSTTRRDRAIKKLQLPIRHNGLGVTSASQRHPLAYFSSLASCVATDPDLANYAHGLRRFAADTHARVLQVVGPASRHTTAAEPFLKRTDPLVLLDAGHFTELFTEEDADGPKDKVRLQRILSHASQALTAEVLQNELQTAVGQQATADLVHACSKDLAARVFTAQLSDKDNRLTRGEFVTWTRRYLQQTQLIDFLPKLVSKLKVNCDFNDADVILARYVLWTHITAHAINILFNN